VNLLLDGVVLHALGARAMPPLTFDLGPGTHALCLESGEAAAELARVACGLARAKRGRVLLGGDDPLGRPALRARIGSTHGGDFSALGGKPARTWFERAHALRASHGGTQGELLGLLSPERLELPWHELSLAERRAFELELALSLENPHAVWLSQAPRLAPEALDRVLLRLRQRAADGAVVVVTVSAEREAALFGDNVHLPRLVRRDAPGVTVQLVVERPREVAAELQGDAAVLSTQLDPSRPTVLLVRGTDQLALCRACSRAALARRCELSEMVLLPLAQAARRGSEAVAGGP